MDVDKILLKDYRDSNLDLRLDMFLYHRTLRDGFDAIDDAGPDPHSYTDAEQPRRPQRIESQ